MKLDQIKTGDVLSYYHDSGCMGASLCYARVLRIGTKKVRVRGEMGEEGWKYPWFFQRIEDAATVAELIADGVTI